jgi:hypothetical protein
MDEDKKLTEEEEALLAEFESERVRAKTDMDADIHKELKEQLAEEVKEVMQKEMMGGIEEEVKEVLMYSMEAAQPSVPEAAAAPAPAAGLPAEDEIRKKIEEEMRLKIQAELEDKIRKEIEEREKQKKEELLKKIQALKKLEEEGRQRAEEEKAREEKIRQEVEEREKQKREELLAKIKDLEQKGGSDKKALEEELRENIRKEMEAERQRKKDELMKKLEAVKPAAADDGGAVSSDEKLILLQLFEEAQRVMYSYLTMRLSRKDIEFMYTESVETATDKHPEILKRALYDKNGNPMPGAALNISRIVANVNMLQLPDDKKARKMVEALHAVFDERLVKIEVKTSNDIKNKMITDLLAAMKKSIIKKGYNPKIESIFMKQIVPSTTLKNGDY